MRRVSGVVPVDWLVGRRQRKLKIIHARRVDFKGDVVLVKLGSPRAVFYLAEKFRIPFVIEDATRFYCILHRRVVLYAFKPSEKRPYISLLRGVEQSGV